MRQERLFYIVKRPLFILRNSMDHLHVLREFLTDSGIHFKEIHHEPAYTSENSAMVRGEELKIGGKAIVMKLDEDFKLFVLAADRKIDSVKIKKYFNVRKLRFASTEELFQLTGLVPGSVPPFGRPILNLKIFVDLSITRNEKIAFNAGSLTDSFIMNVVDYLNVAKATVLDFSVC